MVKNVNIGQIKGDFDRKCANKKYSFQKYYERAAFDRYQKDLVKSSIKAEKKYQSRLRSETIKYNQELQTLETKEIPCKIVEYKKKESSPTLQDYEKISDIVASLLCRAEKMDEQGIVKCTTCSTRAYFWDGETIGAGHFIKRGCKPIRRAIDNVRPQCFINCNDKNNGDGKPKEMRDYLVNEIGESKVCKLEAIRMLDKQKVDSVLVYPNTPRHKEFIVNLLEDIEKICESKLLCHQLSEMSSYQKAKRFAEKWC